MKVHNRIRYWRERLGKTRTQFAAMIEAHPAQVSRWEHQGLQPSVEKYYRLWHALQAYYPGMHLEDLMEPAPEEPVPE